MDLQVILDTYVGQWKTNLIIMVIAHFVLLLLFRQLYRNTRVTLGTKRYVTKTNKLRRNKFSGISLNEYTERRRKRESNTYRGLRSKAKSKVKRYFEYKEEELPGITNYSYGKKLKRNKNKIMILVTQANKGTEKINVKKSYREFIELVNKFNCLDEFVLYLHNLPDALLNRQDYDIYLNEHEVTIGYEVL